ncbi:MAG: hypothetical protein KDA54_01180 [Phycisphaerales bacterium]|nr:hypothetical protein [Phycisphaerales bacterium]
MFEKLEVCQKAVDLADEVARRRGPCIHKKFNWCPVAAIQCDCIRGKFFGRWRLWPVQSHPLTMGIRDEC